MPHSPLPTSATAPEIVVPAALLLDERLMPLERNAWLALRALLSEDGATTLVTYEALRQYLPCAPGRAKASLETVSRTITILRLTGWVVLVEYRRNALAGFALSSRYAVRTVPRAFVEACQADASYLDLLERSIGSSGQAVRQVARQIVMAAADSGTVMSLPQPLRSRLQQLRALVDGNGGQDDDPSNGGLPPSTDQPERPPTDPKAASTGPYVRTSNKDYLKERTYRAREEGPAFQDALKFPARFAQLLPNQQQDVIRGLRRVNPGERQAVLNEWDVRCARGYVRDAAAYLFGLLKKAMAGLFQLWAARKAMQGQTVTSVPGATNGVKHGLSARGGDPSPSKPFVSAPMAPVASDPSRLSAAAVSPSADPVPREVALVHIARIKSMLGRPQHIGDLAQQLLAQGVIGAT